MSDAYLRCKFKCIFYDSLTTNVIVCKKKILPSNSFFSIEIFFKFFIFTRHSVWTISHCFSKTRDFAVQNVQAKLRLMVCPIFGLPLMCADHLQYIDLMPIIKQLIDILQMITTH